jgi:hypothetical protein
MQGLQVDINHLNPGVRYKFIKDNDGAIYSGNYFRSFLTHDTPPESYLIFNKTINETTGNRRGTMSIPVHFIREIYATVSAPSGKKLPADIGSEINSYGGRRNTKRKRVKSKKQKRKNKKTKRRNTTRTW